MKVFQVVSVGNATRRAYRYLSWGHAAALLTVVLMGGISALSLSAAGLIAVSHLINLWPRYRRTSFALVASYSTFLYLVFPVAFIVASGVDYRIGDGIDILPMPPAAYVAVLPSAIVFATVLMIAAAFGISVCQPRRTDQFQRVLRALGSGLPIVLLGLVVLFFTVLGAEQYLSARAGVFAGESLLQFIFFDTAYLILAAVVFVVDVTRDPSRTRVHWRFAFILGLFFLQSTLGSTSKGSILALLLLCFVTPLSFFRGSDAIKTLLPSRKAGAFLAVVAIWAFFVAQGLRVTIFTGEERSLRTFIQAIRSGGGNPLVSVDFSTIGYRLSATLDRYVLLYEAHVERRPPLYSRQFLTYLNHNFQNLMLPGTPYPAAYSPSSNLFRDVVFADPLDGSSSRVDLVRSLNTQPYSLFGVAAILGGTSAPLLVFAFNALLAIAYRLTRNVAVQLTLLTLYWLAFQAYGFEVALATAAHILFSLIVFLVLMRRVRWLSRQLRSLFVPAPKAEGTVQ